MSTIYKNLLINNNKMDTQSQKKHSTTTTTTKYSNGHDKRGYRMTYRHKKHYLTALVFRELQNRISHYNFWDVKNDNTKC